MTIQVHFSEQEQREIEHNRYHHPHPHVQRTMEILWCKSIGLPHQTIGLVAGVCPNTVTNTLKEYREGGLAASVRVNFYQPPSTLDAEKGSLEEVFTAQPPASVKEAQQILKEQTGIERSPSQVRAFLHRLGLKPRKVGMIPAKADREKQQAFLDEQLSPRLAEAQAGTRALFFVDAAHFVLAPFLGILWCFQRLFIQAPAGRQRFNVLAALNALSHELVMVTNDTYINADSVCALLEQLAALNLTVPITLVLDNARFQRCAKVMELAATLQIELLYLPPYAPNLNLIERLWKFVKKKVLYSKYYADFPAFKTAIRSCLLQTHSTYKEELDSLLTLNFHIIQKSQIMPV
jgi:transposase